MDKNTLITSFGKWVSPINIQKLSELVKEQKQRSLHRSLILSFCFFQLHEYESLEEISDALLDEDLQKILGFESISASQLSRKNNNINPLILSHMFLDLVWKIQHYHMKSGKRMPLKIID
ncbi:IS4 family transposase, partial [Bacillus aquiflavi]|nr:IS4 family transposase [Bacillus aquiflavi]NEY83229.1 IS4 family transposase [Bacillus aquiflavi]